MKSPSASPSGKSQHSPGIGSIEIAPRSRWDVSEIKFLFLFLIVKKVIEASIKRFIFGESNATVAFSNKEQ